MKIIFFTHPLFGKSQSMPRYAKLLSEGMKSKGHSVELWTAASFFSRLPSSAMVKKWLGYIDQFFIFPLQVIKRLKNIPANTLFVFTDHALGPWIPLVAKMPHVIHCHDFLAQKSALGDYKENPTGWTGRQYQAFIRQGYKKGENFISVSKKTKQDLHYFLDNPPEISEIVYNGFNRPIKQYKAAKARAILGQHLDLDIHKGYIVHVGGNQWYKNRRGVIEIYNAWRSMTSNSMPLLLIGAKPNKTLQETFAQSAYQKDIHFVTGLDDQMVNVAYAGAEALLYPSLSEGFGWPIAEAMACGCPVITTNEAPMTEVGGKVAFYIPQKPVDHIEQWAIAAAKVLEKVICLSPAERQQVIQSGFANATRFNTASAIDQIETIYLDVLKLDKC